MMSRGEVSAERTCEPYSSTMDSDYEDLTECGLSEELEQKLLNTQRECVFMWTNQLGEAFGVVRSWRGLEGATPGPAILRLVADAAEGETRRDPSFFFPVF